MKEIPTQMLPIGLIEPNKGQIEGLPKNPRLIRDEHFKKLKKSIEDNPEMLYLRELLVYPHQGKYVVIGGNMRLMAMRDLGYTEAPCKIIPEDTTVEQLKAYTIKDNSSFGEFDWDLLANEWDEMDLDNWCIDIPDTNAVNPTSEAHEDDFDPDKPVETVCKKGDIWQLGNHRLMCGDSTDEGDVELLMDGKRADIAFTSPPYNVKTRKDDTKYTKGSTMYNEYKDNLNDDNYFNLLSKSLLNSLANADDALFNIGLISTSYKSVFRLISENINNYCEIIVWNRGNAIPIGIDGVLKHYAELIFCFNNRGTRAFSHPQFKRGNGTNIINVAPNTGNEYAKEHHATFPVAFAAEVITNFTDNSVLDLFGGTGTTLIAAEQLGRKCYMMELDPHYCDVIIARWEKLTGQKAKLLTNTKTAEP